MRNSPRRFETKTTKLPGQWNHVSIEGNDAYAPQNMPIESLDMQIPKIAFGRVLEALGRGEGVAASVEDEMAGGRAGERNIDDAKGRRVSWLGQ